MTYLDNGATSFPKPQCVTNAMICAMETCANPGRGGYDAAMRGAKTLLQCRVKLMQRVGRIKKFAPGHLDIGTQQMQRTGHRVMLKAGNDHTAGGPHQCADSHIQPVGAAGGK